MNLDVGAQVGATDYRFGDQVVEQLPAPNPAIGDTVSWQASPSRDDALQRLREDGAYAALVIPVDFSARLAAIATSGSTQAATIEVLANPASGSYSGAYSQAVAAAVDQVSRASARQLADTLGKLGVTLSPAVAVTVGRPVEATVTVDHPLGDRGGRSLLLRRRGRRGHPVRHQRPERRHRRRRRPPEAGHVRSPPPVRAAVGCR